MAIFRPTASSNSGNKFLGICEFGILDFKDRTGDFDWADLYLEVEIKQKHSEYSRKLQIKGSFEKDSDGSITGGSVLKRMYNFFEVIGCSAGLNVKGSWETSEGEVIESIEEYLNKNFIKGNSESYEPSFDYIGYIYKAMPKNPGDKAWITVHPKIYLNSEDNKVKLQSDIDWLKGKGFLKEVTDEVAQKPTMTGNGLANL